MSATPLFGPTGWTPDRLGSLAGKTYLITGANSGAGFQAARTLLRKDATVVMLNRSVEKSQAAIAELKDELGAGADGDLEEIKAGGTGIFVDGGGRLGDKEQNSQGEQGGKSQHFISPRQHFC